MRSQNTPFSETEYTRRLAITRQAMASVGLDVLVVTDPSNQAWLTGYDGWSFYVHQAVLLPLEGAPLWWGRKMDAAGAVRTVWMADEQVIGYPDHYVQNPQCHPMLHLADVLAELGYSTATIGVEMDNYYYSASAHQALTNTLPNALLQDATALVNWQRLIKSNEEIDFMRRAARISEKVMNLALERAEPGMRKNELIADIYHAAIAGVGDDWGDYPAIVPLAPSGLDATAPHLTWDGAPLRQGEATFFELSGCYRRYHAPLCRTLHLGPAPTAMLKAADALTAGLQAGLEAACAGNRTRDVAAALTAELARAGIDRSGRCGYPVGLSYPPDWGERTASLRPEDETLLEPGMAFHFMPGLWLDDWGLETTETILITENGPAETMCQMPRQLFVKES